MAHTHLNIGSDALVVLNGLKDNLNDGVYINDATVTGELTLAKDEVSLNSFSFDYDTSSDGRYEATIPASVTATLEDKTQYCFRVTAVKDASTFYAELYAIATVKEFH